MMVGTAKDQSGSTEQIETISESFRIPEVPILEPDAQPVSFWSRIGDRFVRWLARRTQWHVPREDIDKAFDCKINLGWHIYEPGQQVGKHIKKFFMVHYVLKYKFLELGLWIFGKIFWKYVETQIPKMHYNTNLLVLDAAFKISIAPIPRT